MPVKVSVVVPVYNPGRYLEACVDSLLGQSLPADQLELIFVDDGSTDGTADRLDALAGAHPQVVVIHEPPSGWPGRPRNVGIEAATGEYIQFVDHDDALGPEALERLYAMARRNDSDVVVGKMVGVGRKVPLGVFRKNLDSATIHDSLLINTLTPHKMVRRELLLRTGLRFPEGRRRLEDHVFVVAAYFAARRISVLADYSCYFLNERDDGGNSVHQRIEPRGYLANLEEALDIVDRHTEPGPSRDRLYRRWLRNELMGRLRGGKLLEHPPDLREAWLREIGGLLARRFDPAADDQLSALDHAAALLARDQDLEALLRLARWEEDCQLDARLVRSRWVRDRLLLDVETGLVDRAGQPLPTEPGPTANLRPPLPSSVLERLDPDTWRLSPHAVRTQFVVRETASHDQRFLSVARPPRTEGLRTRVAGRLVAAELNVGTWDVSVRWHAFGRTLRARVTTDPNTRTRAAIVGTPRRLVCAYGGEGGALAVEAVDDLSSASRAVRHVVRPRPRRSSVRTTRRTVQLRFALPVLLPDGAPLELRLVRDDGTSIGIAARVQVPVSSRPSPTLVAATLDRRQLRQGGWELLLALPGVLPGALPLTTRLEVRGHQVAIRGWSSIAPPTLRGRAVALLPGRFVHRLRALRWRLATRRRS